MPPIALGALDKAPGEKANSEFLTEGGTLGLAVKGRTQRTRRCTATCMLCAVTGWVTVSPHQPLPPLGSAHTCAEVALVEQVSRHM